MRFSYHCLLQAVIWQESFFLIDPVGGELFSINQKYFLIH